VNTLAMEKCQGFCRVTEGREMSCDVTEASK